MYLGGVEVQVIVLLVSSQILVLVVGGRSYQHHPVAVVFTAGVKTHHHAIPLEDLPIKGSSIDKKVSQNNNGNHHIHQFIIERSIECVISTCRLGEDSSGCTFRGNAPSFSRWGTLLASKGPNRVLLTNRRRTNTPSSPLATCLISRLFGKDDLMQNMDNLV